MDREQGDLRRSSTCTSDVSSEMSTRNSELSRDRLGCRYRMGTRLNVLKPEPLFDDAAAGKRTNLLARVVAHYCCPPPIFVLLGRPRLASSLSSLALVLLRVVSLHVMYVVGGVLGQDSFVWAG